MKKPGRRQFLKMTAASIGAAALGRHLGKKAGERMTFRIRPLFNERTQTHYKRELGNIQKAINAFSTGEEKEFRAGFRKILEGLREKPFSNLEKLLDGLEVEHTLLLDAIDSIDRATKKANKEKVSGMGALLGAEKLYTHMLRETQEEYSTRAKERIQAPGKRQNRKKGNAIYLAGNPKRQANRS